MAENEERICIQKENEYSEVNEDIAMSRTTGTSLVGRNSSLMANTSKLIYAYQCSVRSLNSERETHGVRRSTKRRMFST